MNAQATLAKMEPRVLTQRGPIDMTAHVLLDGSQPTAMSVREFILDALCLNLYLLTTKVRLISETIILVK